jgi:hypothetical protein
LDELLPIIRRDFPEFEATHIFEAGIPVYFVRLQVEVLEPQELTSFEIYFLHAIALDVNTREDIATLLGVDDRDLVAPGASLLKREYITQGLPTAEGKRRIFLTEKGRAALGEQKAPPVPARRWAQLHFNALTWTPGPLEDKTWSIEQMDKEGLFILPPHRQERPTLGDFTAKEVAFALQDVPAFQDKQIIALLELKKLTLEYIAPVTVVLLRETATQEQRLVVYYRSMQKRAESDVLQRLFETGHLVLPDDALVLSGELLKIPTALPAVVAQVVQKLTENEVSLRKLGAELTDSGTRRGSTQDRNEREALEQRIRSLQDELQAKHDESELLRKQLLQNQGTFLRTEEHRAVLERALKEAREEVLIISPWLNSRTCDDALCGLVAQAIKRGVRVCIGYGITERAGDLDAGRNRANAQKVIRALSAAAAQVAPPEKAKLLDIRKTSGTHQKILVCDRAFAVLGSFNWLSYRGEQDKEYRNETGILLRDSASVSELARIALREWPSQQE